MQLINFLKNIWSKNITIKDRLLFSLVLMGLSILFFYFMYFKNAIPFTEFQWEFYVLMAFLLSFVVIDFWGNFVIRIWLSISGFIGQIIFFVLLVLVYYLILSPIFLLVNLFRKKKTNINSNWTDKVYINKDYQSMG